MKKNLCLYYIILFWVNSALCIPQYYCTAANRAYFPILKNFIGSLHKHNFQNLTRLLIYDLGLTEAQKSELESIEKCTVMQIEQRHPDILKPIRVNDWGKMVPGWYAWKPVALKQTVDHFPYALWLDAGITVLRPLDALFEHIKNTGSFFASVGRIANEPNPHPIKYYATQFVCSLFHLDLPENQWILDHHSGSAHIIGISQKTKEDFITPVYNLTTSLRPFQDDGTAQKGFGYGRYEQIILSIVACKNSIPIEVQDHSQHYPIILKDKNNTPFYMTYLPHYITGNTHIYHSRGNSNNYHHYKHFIRYKKHSAVNKEPKE